MFFKEFVIFFFSKWIFRWQRSMKDLKSGDISKEIISRMYNKRHTRFSWRIPRKICNGTHWAVSIGIAEWILLVFKRFPKKSQEYFLTKIRLSKKCGANPGENFGINSWKFIWKIAYMNSRRILEKKSRKVSK